MARKKAIMKKVAKKARSKAKRAVKPAKAAPSRKLAGTITHFYPKVSAGVLRLKSGLKVGDRISIEHKNGSSFAQTVASMQMEHQPIKEAKKGQSIGLKVNQEVKEGDKVYLI